MVFWSRQTSSNYRLESKHPRSFFKVTFGGKILNFEAHPKQFPLLSVITSGVLKGYVQGAGGPNHYPLYRPLCLLGIDACIYRDMLR
jgi:hypothetical protein